MQQNYWASVARIFNLKLYERFSITYSEDKECDEANKYYFSDSGLMVILPNGEEKSATHEMFELINGKSKVLFSRFVPAAGDEYWYIMEDGVRLACKKWGHSVADKVRLYTYNCFRNKKEAEYNDKFYYAKLNEYYDTVYDTAYVEKESEDTDGEKNLD